MIRNNSITYEAIESPLMTWKAGDPLLHSFLVALLTTVLSYQLTAILFDLLVGCKAKGSASVTNLTSVLLAHESSLLSAAANMSQNSRLWQWRFNTQGLDVSKLDSEKHTIKLPVRFKFCILFCIAPLLHFVAIVVSLERDSILTFEHVKFGGIALGFTGNQSIDFTRETEECIRYKIGHTAHEVSIPSFHQCSRALVASRSILNTTTFSASKTTQEEILIRLEGPAGRYEMFLRADVKVFEQVYRLRVGILQEEQHKLIGLGYIILAEGCQNPPSPQSASITSSGSMWNISMVVPCPPNRTDVEKAFDSIHHSISVVDTDDFLLIPLNELNSGNDSSPALTNFSSKFIQGSNLPFLRRRRSFLSFVVLCIVTAFAMVFRILLMFLTNNDIDIGIESIVRASMGEECCDYVLQN